MCSTELQLMFSLDRHNFNHWAESYYQCTLALFGSDGLTPYKLKMMLFSNLSGDQVHTPWNHMCEGLEKSNHHANKDYQAKTMRGGGKGWNLDPNLMDCLFSFNRCLQLAGATENGGPGVYGQIARFKEDVHGEEFPVINLTRNSLCPYLEYCKRPVPVPTITVGATRPYAQRLAGLRFVVSGCFKGTDPATNTVLSEWIKELGGKVLCADTALNLITTRSKTPNCFIILKDDTELIKATDGKIAIPKLTVLGLSILKLVSGDFKCLSWKYVRDTRNADCVLGPEDYFINPECLKQVKIPVISDVPPLFQEQMSAQTKVSAFAALKRSRKSNKSLYNCIHSTQL